jgi:aspartyl-tRNA(Asn)/glutamyl-tRNA(Gln) amidotransferase subunit A
MAGWDVADPASVRLPVPDYALELGGGLGAWRVGVDRDYALQGISPEVQTAFEQALDLLVELGVEVVDVSVPGLEEGLSAGLVIWDAEATAVHAEWLRTRPQDYDPAVASRLQRGFSVSGLEVARAQRARRQLVRDLEVLFEQVDLLATPMCAVGAPLHGASQVMVSGQAFDVLAALTRYSRVFNLTGLPAISIPCGFASGGVPIGLQLVGAAFDEVTVLKAAYAYEQATDWHRRHPPLP